MALKGNSIVTYVNLNVKNISPLKIGDSENNILIDKDSQKPFIPGSSIAGSIRNFLSEYNFDVAKKFFGSSNSKNEDLESKIIVFDSFIETPSKLEIRPGVKIDKQNGTNLEGHYFERNLLNSENKFTILIKAFLSDKNEESEFKESIGMITKAINKGYIRLGSNKANGAGVFQVEQALIKSLDLTNKDDFIDYLIENKQGFMKFEYNNSANSNSYVEFIFKGVTNTPILIGGLPNLNSETSDKVNIKNSKGDFIIPGSSLKGSFRAGFEKIATLKDEKQLTNIAFGTDEGDGMAGNIFFEDVVIEPIKNKENKIYNRTKIDKFRSGVCEGALFNEEPVSGKINFKLFYKGNDPKIIKYILFTLKDLGEGFITIGSGNSIGRGEILGETLEINKGNKKAIYGLNNNPHENIEFIKELIN